VSAVVELTRALIRTETINPPGDEAAAARLVGERLEAAGFEIAAYELGPNRTGLVARSPGGSDRPALCMTGHLDTVPLGRAEWSREPLAGEIDGDRLFGRGASDMKGGLAAIVVAAERLAGLGAGDARLELVLCAGEETGCEGALQIAGADGALGRAGALLVAEPTSNYPCTAHKGVVWLDAHTRGRTAHGSMPELGENAVYAMARAIAKLEGFELPRPDHELLGNPTLNVGTVAGGMNVNSVPDAATAGIDIRTVPGLGEDEAIAAVAQLLGDEVRLTERVKLPPVVTDPADPWVADVYEVMAPLIGERPAPRGLAYFTDASALTPAYGSPPTIICGPGHAAQAHQTDEHCSIANLEAAAEGFFEIGRRWCGL
jgi:succinyl-diaminopimelate desuccinylase